MSILDMADWIKLAISKFFTVLIYRYRFVKYLTNGHPDLLSNMQSSGIGSRIMPADEILKNNS